MSTGPQSGSHWTSSSDENFHRNSMPGRPRCAARPGADASHGHTVRVQKPLARTCEEQ